jgi:S1-C subfamily serine protease
MENSKIEAAKPKTLKRVLFIMVLVLIAFLAGIGGELFTRTYLAKMAFFRDFYFTETDNLGQRDLIISQPKKVVVEQDIRLNQLAAEIRPSVLGIYYAKKAGKSLSDNLYLASDLAGQSFVLTSDGWLISSARAIPGSKDDVIIYYNNKAYPIEKIVRDDLIGTVFIKINAQNLPVIKLADLQNISNGQHIFIFNSYYQQVNLANIIDRAYLPAREKNDLIVSSQDLSKRILGDKIFSANLTGSPVFSLDGEIVGLYDQSGASNSQIIPINLVSSIVNQVLKGEKLSRPYLGINYINLNKAVIVNNAQELNVPNKGVYAQSVLSDSPLYSIVVKGDIILSLENQDLDANNDLVDLLMGYKTGQEIKLKYQHLDKEQEIKVILK